MKHHKIMRRGLSVLLSLLMCLTLLPATALAEGTSVAINGANFPDANFRAYVSENFDENKDDTLSAKEIANVTTIDCHNMDIESLKGIEHFTELTLLNCFWNYLTELDVRNNTELTELNCCYNGLTTLDVSKNKKLENLNCCCNYLTALDVRNNTALKELDCHFNKLTKLDVSENKALTSLVCYRNSLTSLDISNTAISNPTQTNPNCSSNSYAITLDENRAFDLKTLPKGFDVEKADGWTGGTVEGNTLTFNPDVTKVTYDYDCGNGHSVTFTLDATPKYTVTAYGLYGGDMMITSGATFTWDYAAGERVGLKIAKRDGYTMDSLELDGITEDDLTWAAKGVENEQRGISFSMPENDVIVTVSWKKASSTSETKTITLNGNGGYVALTSVETGEDGKLSSLITPTRDGYTFDGWFTKSGTAVTTKTVFDQDTTLYAHWTKGVQIVNPFTDVPSGSYYEDAVIWAVSKGITSGTTKTTFSPNSICTRAQAVTFLWNAAGKPKVSGTCAFQDISSGAWYYQAVLWAVQNNITSGTSATTFSPDQICNRAQIVKFMWNAEGQPDVFGTCVFKDVYTGDWYYQAVLWAVQNNVTSGTSATTFSPKQACSRAQIVTFLYRYLG